MGDLDLRYVRDLILVFVYTGLHMQTWYRWHRRLSMQINSQIQVKLDYLTAHLELGIVITDFYRAVTRMSFLTFMQS